MSAEIGVQEALYQALTTAGLTVYDFAPQAKNGGSTGEFPYVEIGVIIFSGWDTFTELGHSFVARIHTRSRAGSVKETKTIQGQIYTALHRQPLAVAGFQSVLLIRETSQCDRAPDGSFHGVCEYRGLIQAA